MYYIKRLEYQVKLNRYKLPNITNKRFLFFYKVINYYILKILPIYYKFSSIRNLNIIRKWLIFNYEGRCHYRGKPVHGQRTWSNASTSKHNNNYLRYYLKEKKRTSNSIRLKDQWA